MKKAFVYGTVLFTSALMGISCAKKSTPASSNDAASTGPTAGSAIVASSVAQTTLTLTWGQASDSTTPAAQLEYKVVSSTSNNITTAANAETNGTLVMDWTANTLTTNVTGLTHSTTYYFAVLVRNSASQMAIETTSTLTLCTGKILYVVSVSNGSLGGKAGADTTCNNNKPGGFGGSAKAALWDGTGGRKPCNQNDCRTDNTGQMDWVFGNNQVICSSDYARKVGTTNAFGYLPISAANSISSSSTSTFTGFHIYFGNSGNPNCADYSTSSGAVSSVVGTANGSGQTWFANTTVACSTAGSIYCVEQ